MCRSWLTRRLLLVVARPGGSTTRHEGVHCMCVYHTAYGCALRVCSDYSWSRAQVGLDILKDKPELPPGGKDGLQVCDRCVSA